MIDRYLIEQSESKFSPLIPSCTMRASESDIIPVVSVGYGRPIGVKFLPPLFEGTPYRAVSFLDLVSSREPFRYSAHNMGVVLETLHPRPKAFVVGIAIDPSYCEEMEKVWNSYVENVLKPESENGQRENNAFVPVSFSRQQHMEGSLIVSTATSHAFCGSQASNKTAGGSWLGSRDVSTA